MIFLLSLFINCRAEYLELLEIGENYTEVFYQNIKYKIIIGSANFVFIFSLVCITNSFIKKGLKKFFEEDKIEMPKLPNKSLALIIALVISMITPNLFLEKLILFKNSAQFGISEPIFNMDIGFYMTRSTANRASYVLSISNYSNVNNICCNILYNNI